MVVTSQKSFRLCRYSLHFENKGSSYHQTCRSSYLAILVPPGLYIYIYYRIAAPKFSLFLLSGLILSLKCLGTWGWKMFAYSYPPFSFYAKFSVLKEWREGLDTGHKEWVLFKLKAHCLATYCMAFYSLWGRYTLKRMFCLIRFQPQQNQYQTTFFLV